MAFQTWLADVLINAGLKVVEEPSWRTRSADEDLDASLSSPLGVIIHETRGSATSTATGEISVLINGRVGLSGPIAQLFLSRAGVWHVVAAGLCHHVKTGWGGPFAGLGNTRLLGIEAQHAESESWAAKPEQYASYVRGVAAICKHKGWSVEKVVGHKEHQPGDKPDPEFDMNRFRADVRAVMSGDEDDMKLYQVKGQAAVWAYDGVGRRHVPDEATLARVKAATGATVTVLASQADLDLIAPLPVKVEPAAVVLSAEDRAAIVADLAAALAVPSAAEVADAVLDEDHRRSES